MKGYMKLESYKRVVMQCPDTHMLNVMTPPLNNGFVGTPLSISKDHACRMRV